MEHSYFNGINIFFCVGLTNAYARGAKQNGARIIEDAPVSEIIVDEDSKGNRFIQGVMSEKGKVSNDLFLSLIHI